MLALAGLAYVGMDNVLGDAALSCPLWVRFYDIESGLPFFYNVETREHACYDPDPEGFVSLLGQEAPEPTSSLLPAADASTCSLERPGSPPRGRGSRQQHLLAERVAGSKEALAAELVRWHTRPARVQKAFDPDEAKQTAYIQGDEDYNVWYGKFENNRFDPRDREPASTKCDPALDSGWTEADLPGAQQSVFCLYFALGCCRAGHKCKFYHRVPSLADIVATDAAHDAFGRVRFASHRDDMNGVGSFNNSCLTLFIGDISFERSAANPVMDMEMELLAAFGAWGDIEEVNIIARKAFAFVTYAHRASAEFAKVAMANQKMGKSRMLAVKWAQEDPRKEAKKAQQTAAKRSRLEENLILECVARRRLSEAPEERPSGADAERAATLGGISKMAEVLSRIDVLHSSGSIPAPAL